MARHWLQKLVPNHALTVIVYQTSVALRTSRIALRPCELVTCNQTSRIALRSCEFAGCKQGASRVTPPPFSEEVIIEGTVTEPRAVAPLSHELQACRVSVRESWSASRSSRSTASHVTTHLDDGAPWLCPAISPGGDRICKPKDGGGGVRLATIHEDHVRGYIVPTECETEEAPPSAFLRAYVSSCTALSRRCDLSLAAANRSAAAQCGHTHTHWVSPS